MAKCKHCGSRRDLLAIETGEHIYNKCYTTFDYALCRCGMVFLKEEGKERCNKCESKIYEFSCNDYSTKPRTEDTMCVRIDEVAKSISEVTQKPNTEAKKVASKPQAQEKASANAPKSAEGIANEDSENFDYSDFEIEDESI